MRLDVVVPVPVLPGGVSGCTVELVADMGDIMPCSYWSLTGSFGTSWRAGPLSEWCWHRRRRFRIRRWRGSNSGPLLVPNRYGESQFQLRCSALCCPCCCLLCRHAWRCVHCDSFGFISTRMGETFSKFEKYLKTRS